MKNVKQSGYVYILTNPSFREDWVKIGKSSYPIDIRSKQLDNTAVPLPFEIFATLKTSKYEKVEKLIHKMIDKLTDLRIRKNREFFNISPQRAMEIFEDVADTIDDAVIIKYRNNKPIIDEEIADDNHDADNNMKRYKRGRFKFSMVGINAGEYIVFDPLNINVKVAGDDTVEYEGHIRKLSQFVKAYLPENMKNKSGAYQGARYFSFNGKTLFDLRNETEALTIHKNTLL